MSINNRILLLFLLVSACIAGAVTANAQRLDNHLDPSVRAALARASERLAEATRILENARTMIKNRRYAQVVSDCERAIALYSSANFPEAGPAHEVLAEYYLARKQYSDALREASIQKDGAVGLRLNMTKALALIGLGRVDEASDLVAGEVGTSMEPKSSRKTWNLWELPWDRSSSEKALTATVYLVRAVNAMSTAGDRDAENDIETALRLAPQNPAAELLFGVYLFRSSHYREAIGHLEAAEKLARKRQTIDAARSLKRRAQEAALKTRG